MRSVADVSGQIRTRERVRELAEVYTHDREVNAMLDLIPDMFPSTPERIDAKFLEPGCGSGNFLVAILKRKLAVVHFERTTSTLDFEYSILRAVASIYGVDICPENVHEARSRVLEVVHAHYFTEAQTIDLTDGFISAVNCILVTNIVLGDFLQSAEVIEFVDYEPVACGYFRRCWSTPLNPRDIPIQTALFAEAPEPRCDREPVHYLDLASNPHPVGADLSRRSDAL